MLGSENILIYIIAIFTIAFKYLISESFYFGYLKTYLIIKADCCLDKENMYRNTSSSSRQPKSLIIKKRPLSRKRSSSTTKNTNFREINDNNDSSMSFESSLSSDDENYEDIQECREIDESELVHISSHTNQKTLSSHKSN